MKTSSAKKVAHDRGDGVGRVASSQDIKSLQHSQHDSRTQVVEHERAKAKVKLSEYIAPIEKIQALKAIRDAIPGNTGATQEKRILEALSSWSLTTYEASRFLDSYDPRARVMQLRDKGHNIVTSWTLVRTECGRLHRVGVYTLQRGAAPASQPHQSPKRALHKDAYFAKVGTKEAEA